VHQGITDNLKHPAFSREAAHLRWRALAPLVDRELQRIAFAMVNGYRGSGTEHSIEPAELVNEFYLRLLRDGERRWEDRSHFYAYAGAVMRTVLIDRHRARLAQKRPPAALRASLSALAPQLEPLEPDQSPMIELRFAIERLEQLSPRQALIVEWKYFRGIGLEEIAAHLELSEKTVRRDWIAARAFLLTELSGSNAAQE
jgi:RNA polymerase sigma factor (TIGR02999 family)